MSNQLRYHDTIDDHNPRGFIDLAEVESVSLVKFMPGAPKTANENSFIEVIFLLFIYLIMINFYICL